MNRKYPYIAIAIDTCELPQVRYEVVIGIPADDKGNLEEQYLRNSNLGNAKLEANWGTLMNGYRQVTVEMNRDRDKAYTISYANAIRSQMKQMFFASTKIEFDDSPCILITE
jgi:hypothetical protein